MNTRGWSRYDEVYARAARRRNMSAPDASGEADRLASAQARAARKPSKSQYRSPPRTVAADVLSKGAFSRSSPPPGSSTAWIWAR